MWNWKTRRNHAKLVKLQICYTEPPVKERSIIAFAADSTSLIVQTATDKCRRVPEVKDIAKSTGGCTHCLVAKCWLGVSGLKGQTRTKPQLTVLLYWAGLDRFHWNCFFSAQKCFACWQSRAEHPKRFGSKAQRDKIFKKLFFTHTHNTGSKSECLIKAPNRYLI